MKRESIWLILALYLLAGCAEKHDKHNTGHEHGAVELHDHESYHKGEANHLHEHEHEATKGGATGGEIVFSHAEAEAIGLTTRVVVPEKFHGVIPCSGVLQAAQGDEVTLVSPMSGVVAWATRLNEGSAVSKGSTLLRISAERLESGDPSQRARIEYETARRAYERAQELVKEQIVSQQEYERVYREYETARLAYEAIGGQESGSAVTATMGGYLKNIRVQDGDFVEKGEVLMTLSQNRRLQLRVDVPQRYYKSLASVTSAHFKTPYDNQVYELERLNGHLLSYGKGAQAGGAYLPVVFELDNSGDMIPGAYVEAWLLTGTVENALVIPRSALTEEQGLHFVYLRLDEECYKKQEVTVGESDGVQVRILDGLHEGDRVVTRGVYQVKLAANGSVIPEGHSHNH